MAAVDVFILQILWPSLSFKYSRDTNSIPQHCASISVLPSLRFLFFFFSHPRPASISDAARSADRRRARGHRLCAPLFTFCLTSEWKKGQSPPPPASASPHPREATKPKKCCPQAVCVFRWRSASNRSTRSNVVYDAPPPLSSQVHFGHATKKKKKSATL